MYKSNGEENLRADPHVYHGVANASPAGKGEDAGGTENKEANFQVKTGATKETKTYSKDDRPAGVQHFGEVR